MDGEPTVSKPVLILIIGVGRSGTSALTRTLSLCGCMLPDRMMGSISMNPKGCWEPIDMLKADHEFLLKHGTAVLDPSLRFQETAIDEREHEEFITKIQAFLGSCPRGRPLLVKEPAITELMTFWREAARREGFSVRTIIPIRHPDEVSSSLVAFFGADTVSRELATAFWIKRNLLAERSSRDLPRIFVEYSKLMKDWRSEVARIASALSIDLAADAKRIDDFLSSELYRQKHQAATSEPFGYPWATRIYGALSAAATDAPVDMDTLDEIYKAYYSNARAFQIAFDQFSKIYQNCILASQLPERLSDRNVPVWISGRDF